ncbi:MAG TPA: hypothetical protein G4O02_05765 [Caldilineae bacterium]|jgi:hypothetical protein|nr:hypothetical protein [Caldilineae bacterium]
MSPTATTWNNRLPEPDMLAEQIIEDLHEILAQLQSVLNELLDWEEVTE